MVKLKLLPMDMANGAHTLDIFKATRVSTKLTQYAQTKKHADSWMVKGNYSLYKDGYYIIDFKGESQWLCDEYINIGLRPFFYFNEILEKNIKPYLNEDGIFEIEYGEYPQSKVSPDLSDKLEKAFKSGLEKGKQYTIIA